MIEGGTHAANAPVFDYFERVYLPCLRRMGAEVTAVLDRVGFYPADGGKIELSVIPVREWKPLVIDETGVPKAARLVSISHGIDAKNPGRRTRILPRRAGSARTASKRNRGRSIPPAPGNVMFAELEFEHVTELFSVCGDFDLSRKAVGEPGCGHGQPVPGTFGTGLAVPRRPAAAADGDRRGRSIPDLPPGRHTQTNIEVIRKFLEIGITVENRQNGQYRIEVKQ